MSHVKSHAVIYLMTMVSLVLGVVFGSLAVNVLSAAQKSELLSYVVSFVEDTGTRPLVSGGRIAQRSLYGNLRTIGLVCVLGASVIGAPLILVVLFARGFIMGFTVGFLVDEMVLKGVVVSLASVLPSSVFALPGLIGVSTGSLCLAATLLRGRFGRAAANQAREIVSALTLTGLSSVMLLVAGFLDGYVAPVFMQLAARFLI